MGPAFGLKFLPAVEHGALAEDEGVERLERGGPGFDGGSVGGVDLGVGEAGEVAARVGGVGFGGGAGAPDVDGGAVGAEGLGDAVADAAGAADDEGGAVVEVEGVGWGGLGQLEVPLWLGQRG
jgi:hypothetical protein